MKHPGIGEKKKFKDEMKGFSTLTSIMKGEPVYTYKRREMKPRMKKNEMEEKKLEREIILMIRSIGLEAYKTGETATYNSNFCEVGSGDITVKGSSFKIFYLEVKVKGRVQNNNQIKAQKRCKDAGIGYYVVYSKVEAIKAVKDERL